MICCNEMSCWEKDMSCFKNQSACGKPEAPKMELGDTNPYENVDYINEYAIYINKY